LVAVAPNSWRRNGLPRGTARGVDGELADRAQAAIERLTLLPPGQPVGTVAQAVVVAQRVRERLAQVPHLGDDHGLSAEESRETLQAIAWTVGLSLTDVALPGPVAHWADDAYEGCSGAQLRAVVVCIAEKGGREPAQLIEDAITGATTCLELVKKLERALPLERVRIRSARLMLDRETLEAFTRAEAHTTRQLFRTLREWGVS
jgi:hypothetical protein